MILTAIGLARFFTDLAGPDRPALHAENNLQLTARAISYTTEAALVFNDPAAAHESLEFIAKRGDFTQAKNSDPAGATFTEWQRPVNSNWDKLAVRRPPGFPGACHDAGESFRFAHRYGLARR